MAYLGRDEWDARRPEARRANRSSFYLDPDAGNNQPGLSRTRSQGAQPRPIINLYNEVYNDSINRTEYVGAQPQPQPQPPGAFPIAYPVVGAMPAYAPQYRPDEYERGRRLNDQLADGIAQLHLLERSRSRARSRSRSNASPDDFYRHEVEKLEREKQWKYEQDRIKAEAEVQYLKEDARRRQHEIDEHAERKRIVAEYEKKRRDDEEAEKEAEKRYAAKMEREKREAKEKEEAAYNKFLLKQKEEEEKKKKAAAEEKEKVEDAMRKKLAEKGFAGNQIEAIISDKKKETSSMTIYRSSATPVFAKVHRSFLSVDTLKYYGVPWKWDDADSDYIIILQEMDTHETDVLFAHTRALREGRLLIEAPKKEKEYAFYRKRDRSKSRNRGEWKSFGILEYKK